MPLTELLDDGVAYQFSVAQISTMPFEEIHTNPEAFAQTVQKLTAEDLANMGIQVVSFTIREIQDPSGYLQAIGRPKLADVQKDAAVGEANAQRDTAIGQANARRESSVNQANALRQSQLAQLATEVAVIDAKAERDKRQAEVSCDVSEMKAASDLAYELSTTKTRQLMLREQLLVRDLEIAARERELVEKVQKPAEAERQRIETLAQAERTRLRLMAEAEGMRKKAEAWQNYNSAALADLIVAKLPEIAAAVAAPLSKIDKIVLIGDGGGAGGVEHITRSVTQVIAQVPAVVEAVSGVNLNDLLGRLRSTNGAAE
jgi:flotillin